MMRQGFKRCSKGKANSPAYPFLELIQQFQVATRSTSPYMNTVFHAWPYGRFIEIRATSGERNFIEWIKAPIFLEAVLAIETMQEPQSSLEEKVNPSILKIIFPHEQTHPRDNSTSVIRPVKQSKLSFSSIEINKPLPASVHSVS